MMPTYPPFSLIEPTRTSSAGGHETESDVEDDDSRQPLRELVTGVSA